MKKDSLGDRMKDYEGVTRTFLTRRTPVIIRVDGQAFHTFTKGFKKPVDPVMAYAMEETAGVLCKNIQGAKVAYVQSDEISVLLTDYETIETQPWFNNNVQKMASVSASLATMAFNVAFRSYGMGYCTEAQVKRIGLATFDSRVFPLPKDEVCNYFVWRQQDAVRNAIQALGQAHFSHGELQGVTCDGIVSMLRAEKGIVFDDLPATQKRGVCIVKKTYETGGGERGRCIRTRWVADHDTPVFAQDREYIERYL